MTEAVFVDIVQGFSHTNNRLSRDSRSPTNPEKNKYKETHEFWCVLSW